jgi:hypothetical protein
MLEMQDENDKYVEALSELQGTQFSMNEIKNNKESIIDRVKQEKQDML